MNIQNEHGRPIFEVRENQHASKKQPWALARLRLSFPWASWSICPPPSLPDLTTLCLESMTHQGIKLGTITSHLNTLLKQLLHFFEDLITSALWDLAGIALSARKNAEEIDGILGLGEKEKSVCVCVCVDEALCYREAIAVLRLAKEVIKVEQGRRKNAVKHLNQTGGFSRCLANSATDWPCLLLELLSAAFESDYFQVLKFVLQLIHDKITMLE